MIIKGQLILQIDRARKRRDPTTSVATPAIAGGLFAVDRKWFQKIGWWGTLMAPTIVAICGGFREDRYNGDNYNDNDRLR